MTHAFRVEIQFAGAIETPEHMILGDNVVDAAFAFGISAPEPPEGVDDITVNKLLTHHLSQVIAAVTVVMQESLGFLVLGQIEETMVSRSRATGQVAQATPVVVHLVEPAPGDTGRPS